MMKEMKSKRLSLLLLLAALMLSGCAPSSLSFDKLPWLEPGEVIFQDDFSDQSTGWEKVNSPYELKGYSAGGYLISVKTQNSRAWSVVDLPLSDTEIRVKTEKISGPEDTNFGIICRFRNEDNFYSFLISSDGYYGIMKVENGVETLLGSDQFTYSEQINLGSALNQIEAICSGNELSLSVNGQMLQTVKDTSFPTGKVGMIVETRAEGDTAIVFSDFVIIKR
jgi:hypothetical protein